MRTRMQESIRPLPLSFFFGVQKYGPWLFFPQTVCPHYGVLTVGVRSGVLRGVLPQRRLSTAQARTEFRVRRQCRTEW